MLIKNKFKVVKAIAAVTFLGMIGVNAMANILPINGVNTGQVSDSFQNLFAPAGLTFAIWGVIYLLLASYTIYQSGFFYNAKSYRMDPLLGKIGVLFSISSVANMAWIFSWQYFLIPLSMLFMAIILVCLIFINKLIIREKLSAREVFFIRIPFSVYFGWITVAAIANVTVLLVSVGWNGFNITENMWTIIILLVGTCIGTLTMLKNKDIAYGLVLIWAYAGILIKHTSSGGFSSQYPAIITTVWICLGIFLVGEAVILFGKKKKHG